MKLFQVIVALVSLEIVTGFLISASPRSSTGATSIQMGRSDPVIQFEQDGHESIASEADMEKMKQLVAERVVEEQRRINKTVQKELA